MTAVRVPTTLKVARRVWSHPVWLLASWVYLAISVFLVTWILLSVLLVGLRPIVVSSGSMSPGLRPGDVLLVADPTDLVAPGTIITFEDPDSTESITHRVVEITEAGYVTRGDANPSVDAAAVSPEEVTGIGRLVVPFAGLPALWLSQGNVLLFGLWALVTIGVILSLVTTKREDEQIEVLDSLSARLSAPGLRRVRLLAIALLVGQYLADPSHFDSGAAISGSLLVGLVAGGLLAVNMLSLAGTDRTGIEGSRLAIIEIVVDSSLVLVLMLALGDSAVTWIALAVPIIGAVARFRMTGALVLWVILAVVLLGADMLSMPSGGEKVVPTILRLRETVERLGIVLVVVVPGGYLLEQLLVDVGKQQRATTKADRRSNLLRDVVAGSRELNRLGGSAADGLIDAACKLGYPEVAVIEVGADGVGRSLGQDGTPDVFQPVEHILRRHERGPAGSVAILHRSVGPGPESTRDVAVCELTRRSDDDRVVLCVASPASGLSSDDIEAIELLAFHARVALDNERLLSSVTAMRDQMERQALYDTLTGLPSRLHFHRKLQQALDQAPDRSCVGLMFIDLDGFKEVNDSRGHESGDEVLRVVAARLESAAGESAFVSRLGGDEFTILVEQIDRAGVEAMAAGVLAAVEEPIPLSGVPVHVSTSIGIAFGDSRDASELLRRSDMAMYAAKAAGKRQSRFFSDDLDVEGRRSRQLSSDIGVALRGGELRLEYSALVEPVSGQIRGARALVRWDHIRLGLVDNAEILTTAETAGLDGELWAWTLRQAADVAARWTANSSSFASILVDLPRGGMLDGRGTADAVTAATSSTGLDPATLILAVGDHDLVDEGELAHLRASGAELMLTGLGGGAEPLVPAHHSAASWIGLSADLVAKTGSGTFDESALRTSTQTVRELGMGSIVQLPMESARRDLVTQAGADLVHGPDLSTALSAEAFEAALIRQSDVADRESTWS